MYLTYILPLVLTLTCSSHGASLPPPSSCKPEDINCMKTAARNIYGKVLAGDKALGIEPLEPMLIEEIDGSLNILKYKMTNTTITGFNKCQMNDLKLDMNNMNFILKIVCPRILYNGDYEMDGRVIVLPVKGKGKYSLVIDEYELTLTSSYKIVKDGNGKEYFNIKTYQADAEPKKGVKFEFQNLFNGKKELADPVHKFVNENWKEVTHQFQGPMLAGSLKKLIKNTNKILKAMPMERVFL